MICPKVQLFDSRLRIEAFLELSAVGLSLRWLSHSMNE